MQKGREKKKGERKGNVKNKSKGMGRGRVVNREGYGDKLRYGKVSFLMHVVAHVPHYLIFDSLLAFDSFLSARVSEFRFSHPMSYPTS